MSSKNKMKQKRQTDHEKWHPFDNHIIYFLALWLFSHINEIFLTFLLLVGFTSNIFYLYLHIWRETYSKLIGVFSHRHNTLTLWDETSGNLQSLAFSEIFGGKVIHSWVYVKCIMYVQCIMSPIDYGTLWEGHSLVICIIWLL